MAYRIGFVIEQTLGQITHTQNFQRWVEKDATIDPTWVLLPYESRTVWGSVPVVSRNWTLRASLEARAHVRDVLRSKALDGLFFHTQATALFAHRLMANIPSVVSMDATPLNFDSIGAGYDHVPSRFQRIERMKHALTCRSFERARRLVVWHRWGRDSLVKQYGVPTQKVDVIAPGIDLERWNFPRVPSDGGRRIRLLFVGGDFRRKGGEELLAAFSAHLQPECELDIVTREPVGTTGLHDVRVHHGLGSNAPGLLALYAQADVFVFPTFSDVLPLAIMEAMASGLPVVTTDVGAITEQIEDGDTGFLVPPGDTAALAEATLRLVRNADLRHTMSARVRRVAEERFNSAINYARLAASCKQCIESA
jgi:glycosyltransferase involved in cell wall biosynthesis